MKKIIIYIILAIALLGITIGIKYHNISLDIIPTFNIYFLFIGILIGLINLFIPISFFIILSIIFLASLTFTLYYFNFGLKGLCFSLIYFIISKSIILFLLFLSLNYLLKMYKSIFLAIKNKNYFVKIKKYFQKNAISNGIFIMVLLLNTISNYLFVNKISTYLLF